MGQKRYNYSSLFLFFLLSGIGKNHCLIRIESTLFLADFIIVDDFLKVESDGAAKVVLVDIFVNAFVFKVPVVVDCSVGFRISFRVMTEPLVRICRDELVKIKVFIIKEGLEIGY